MFAYHTPGVYFESLDTQPPSILPLRTDIAGFVGIAQRGPYHCPVKVDSWTQFTSTFGRFIPQGYLAYAVEGFFANGGQTCYVVRVLDPMVACPATLELPGEGGPADKPVLTLTASSPGVWGEDIVVTVIRLGADSFSLILQLADGGQELWRDLTLSTVANVLGNGKSSSRLVSANRASPEATPPRAGTYRLGDPTRLGSQPGRDGLATLTLAHFSGVGAPPDKRWGLATLDLVDEVSIVAMPDIVPKSIADIKFVPPPVRCDAVAAPLLPKHELSDSPEYPPPFQDDEILALQGQLIGHCERLKDRMAILDAPQPLMSPEAVRQWRKQFDSKYAALYYPWLRMPDPQGLEGLLRNIPPSGHVAGIYARVEQQVGVHKPPANELVDHPRGSQRCAGECDSGLPGSRPACGRGTHPERRPRLALCQRASSADHARTGHRPADPVDGVRAEQPRAVARRRTGGAQLFG